MRHQLINGESIEITRLDNEVLDPDKMSRDTVFRYAVTFFDVTGTVVASYSARFVDKPHLRKQGRGIKDHGPENILAGMRFVPEITLGNFGSERMEAIHDLFVHFRRNRLLKAKKLR